MVALTTLTDVAEFTSLSYKRSLGEIGDCEFVVLLKSPKITNANLEMYNRVEIIEDGVVKFNGVIVNIGVNIDTARVRCRESIYILKKRIMGADYVANGSVATEVADLLTAVNSADDTGIDLGDVSGAVGSVNTTFNRANAFEVLKQITKATGNEFKLDSDRTIRVAASVGQDLSENVIFRYETNLVEAANILQFDVEDDGSDIATTIYGKSGANTTTQTDAVLEAKYGKHESYKDFRVANTLAVLEAFAGAEISDRIFSPNLTLDPEIGDVFDVGDTVRVVLKNSLIDIDTNYKVLEKKVQYNGDQKRISVRINDLPNDIAEKLADRDRRIELLEKEI